MTTLYEWFARSAARHPDAVAVEVADGELTYRALERTAATIAAELVGACGGRPRRVGLLASRSVAAFAGYLAVQRLGAIVVPVNPGHPVPRNRLIVETARLDALIADAGGAAQVEAGVAAGVPAVLGFGAAVASPVDAERAPLYPAVPDDVAYVLFTSGSTGRPKGVPIRHRNLAPYIAHNIRRYAVTAGCRMSHTFDLTFDPSVFDLFVTWGGGATLVCPQRTDLLTPVDYLVERRLTHWFSVPSVVGVGTDLGTLPAGLATGVRHSVFIGEQLSYRRARAWRAAVPNAPVDNVYGPTELTVACTEYRLPDDPARWPATGNDTVPIGDVYSFLDHMVVDEDGRPAPDGELCVRGPQRFDGYLDPADDAGRFVTDTGAPVRPGETVHDGHFYRTGDRVRREHGHLVHLGRLDHQLKVRGYRIELGEIEAVLARRPGIAEVVVLATTGDDVDLLACYTGTPAPDRDLVRWLRARLPIHMVPRRFHHVTAIPLSPNGKTDRRALHDLVTARSSEGS